MSSECGPWRSCDLHQYRSWLRKTDGITPSSPPMEKDKQKAKKLRRRQPAGDFRMTFRHHTDPAEYERDYLTQVTHARCRANPSATLLATELTSMRSSVSDRTVVQLLPPQTSPPVERRFPAASTPTEAPSAPASAPVAVVHPLLDTASTPDLSAASATSPSRPTPPSSSPDLCQLPQITAGPRARRQSLPPSPSTAPPAAAAASASTDTDYRKTAGHYPNQSNYPSPVQPPARQARSVSLQREGGDQPAGLSGPQRSRRLPPRQTSTLHTVTLDLPSPHGFGCPAQARRNGHKPRGLTKIQLASSVPENLTIIVGRKLEISLGGNKRGRQKGRGFR